MSGPLDRERILELFDEPSDELRFSLRCTAVSGHPSRSADESPFATVRLRQRVTKGAGSRTKGARPA